MRLRNRLLILVLGKIVSVPLGHPPSLLGKQKSTAVRASPCFPSLWARSAGTASSRLGGDGNESRVGPLAGCLVPGEVPSPPLGPARFPGYVKVIVERWTAQMLLIFSLGRPDVLPVDDFGLKTAVRRHYGLTEMPARAVIEEKARPWRPWASIATWYLWRSLDAK